MSLAFAALAVVEGPVTGPGSSTEPELTDRLQHQVLDQWTDASPCPHTAWRAPAAPDLRRPGRHKEEEAQGDTDRQESSLVYEPGDVAQRASTGARPQPDVA
ncbi:hypothetical protein OG883_38775 [Streptomyces sp. NBC_01142]|uniref:hypothetical protein n=1 Tax=Streptomyces sp. NBC_01142 TaxID=2975865 RepID=UPI00225A240F|nr:hypothetical protein [Streptomyces sp. NBC_01142]MCX4825689.1 hypothetical protein [Streptomyces sp. NBC_01142]